MNFIVAADEKWQIGYDGGLLTHIPEDLKFFKEKTSHETLVLGRKTLESFPGGKPLPNRHHIVLTRNKDYSAPEGVELCHSIDELLERLETLDSQKVWLIGGGTLYKALIPYCDYGYVTVLRGEYKSDTSMPNLDQGDEWSKISDEEWRMSKKDVAYKFTTYKKIK